MIYFHLAFYGGICATFAYVGWLLLADIRRVKADKKRQQRRDEITSRWPSGTVAKRRDDETLGAWQHKQTDGVKFQAAARDEWSEREVRKP